jgi:hypothetical protein
MTLGEFYTLLRTVIARGSSMDPLLPTFTAQALRWLERNNSFKYMVDVNTTVLPLGNEAGFAALGLPVDETLKSIDSVTVEVPEQILQVKQVMDVSWVTEPPATPTLYWIDWKNKKLRWNAEVNEARPVRLHYAQFSLLPSSTASSLWLLENASDVLLYQAVVQFAMVMRDVQLAQSYAAMRDQGLRTLALQQEAQEQANSELWMGRIREAY